MTTSHDIETHYVHLTDHGRAEVIPVDDAFWPALAAGQMPALEAGRLMSAFSFSGAWSMWERHPAGEELVMLLSGAVTVVLDQDGAEAVIELSKPGAYALVPKNVWHTARSTGPATLLFLTPGAGTQHHPVDQGPPSRVA